MTEKNRNLLIRIASAVVLLPLVLWLLHRGGYWSAGLMALAAGICAFEYYTIVFKALSPVAVAGIAGAGLMPLTPAFAPAHPADLALWIIAGMFFVAWTYHLIRGPLSDAPARAAQLFTGLFYAGFGLTALSAVRLLPHGLVWVYCALIITWANDTSAYFAGRLLGRHKLYPAVSPNKTWEGFAGGMVGAILGLVIAKYTGAPSLRWVDCVVLGVGGSICGPIGDLCESMLKRAYEVKDSGKTIPGHGGMLDRIDALIFNAPFVLLYVHSLRHFFF